MKNKSGRHKSENTFRFIPFAERIKNVDVDIFHKVAHENEDADDENECIFFQTIEKWNVLNLTESFSQFKREIRAFDIITLPQLIFNKERVKDVLITHLKLKDDLVLQPLFDLVVSFAKDLRQDFYQFYFDFFEVLIELLNTKNSERLEWTFQCLAYLFKFLWRPIIGDIPIVFKALLPLLSAYYPSYINNFAAESFAFIARKVKHFKAFLFLILKSVTQQKDGITGCSRLLYEVIKGITGQFHSCANNILPILLHSLHDENSYQEELFQVLEKVTEYITEHINPSNSSIFYSSLINAIETQHSKLISNNDSEIHANSMNKTLILLGQSLEYKSGRFLQTSTDIVAKTMIKILQTNLPISVALTTVKISIILLGSRSINLPQNFASTLLQLILNWKDKNVFLYFVENTFDYPLFDTMVFPKFVQHCCATQLNDECLTVLINVLLHKAPLCLLGNSELSNWQMYPIEFGSQKMEMAECLLNFLKYSHLNEIDYYTSATIIVPHLKGDSIDFKSKIAENIGIFCEKIAKLNKDEDATLMQQLLFLLISSVECFAHLNVDATDFQSVITIKTNLEKSLVSLSNKFLLALKTLDLFYTFLQTLNVSFLDVETVQMLHDTLKVNFNSPLHKIRLHTSHIYSLFESAVSTHYNNTWTLFSLCYQVESISPQVDTYRDQLQALEKLNFDRPQMQLAVNTVFMDIPLRYLCGVLYMNFKLLWDPVIDIITSHAQGMNIESFWPIYHQELCTATENVKDMPSLEPNDLVCKFSSLGEMYRASVALNDKPDYFNYRVLLWIAMSKFTEVAEAKNRDTVELFLSFINTEYRKINSDMAFTVNIKSNTPIEISDEKNEDESQLEKRNDDLDEIKRKLKQPVMKSGANNALTLLLHHLGVFTKVKNPKLMHRESELYNIYLEFLGHKNAAVQTSILECLLTYRNKNIIPYSINLRNLINEKTLKNETIQFKLDQATSPILQQHRDHVLPLVLKIVYSKIIGKFSGKTRHILLFRYLSGCSESEMELFMKMAFKYYESFLLTDTCKNIIVNVRNSIDLEHFVPPKRLQSTLNLLSTILEQFGNLMHRDMLTFLLKVLFVIGGSLNLAFDNKSAVFPGYLPLFRSIRTSAIKLMTRFFSKFEYSWHVEEIDCIFELFISPQLRKIDLECVQNPTALLQLFGYWASNPMYYKFLVKRLDDSDANEENAECVPLDYIIKLLIQSKLNSSVHNFIMEMIENMLKLKLNDGEIAIDCKGVIPIENSILDRLKIPGNNLNYGSCILLPYVSQILTKMKGKIDQKTKSISHRELIILSRISGLIWESELCDSTLDLLIPILQKRAKSGAKDEDVLQLLITVSNLLRNVDNSSKHIHHISPLFGYVRDISGRKVLCDILANIAQKHEQFLLANELIVELNSYNAKWLEQPDFNRRLSAYRRIENLFKEDGLSMELMIILVYDCFHTIQNEKDMSLRENAIDCLKDIIPALVLKHYTTHGTYIIDETVFPLLKNGLKTVIRNDCITLLGILARECSHTHVILRDLHKLTNKTDVEVDFFENLIHLQLHRQSRALLKFREVFSKEMQAPNIRTLTQYLLPFAIFYLEKDEFVSKHYIIDSACDVLSTIARFMPWHHYESLLKTYLGKLMRNVGYQKQLVKIVVCILDAYHFDLSHGVDEFDKQDEKNNENTVELTMHKQNEHDQGENVEESNSDDDESSETNVSIIKPFEKTSILCKSTAKRIINTIKMVLLPELNRVLAMKTNYESTHKLNQKKTTRLEREDEDLIRIPITIAVVKLLQRLPKAFLDRNLPGVIMKLCTFLKSKLESVRRAARETLQKIVIALGPDYLSIVIAEMTSLSYKGYQMHVIVFTIHAVLNCMKPHYKEGHCDSILLTVMHFVMQDLFGVLADEREVHQIANKVKEASSPKSLDTLHIMAQFISERCILDIVLPIKKILGSSQSLKVVNKAEECLKQIAIGLVDNEFISIESALKFAFGTASQSIPDLLYKEQAQLTQEESEKLLRGKPDCYIIPKAPVGRTGVRVNKVKSSQNANAHLLIEFGLKLCNFLLKRDKLKSIDFKAYLDPFVIIVMSSLSTSHVKLNTISLQCLEWLLKYDLPSLKMQIAEVAKSLFAILHKYASGGLRKGDNFDLVVAAFKAMSVLVRDVKYHVIETEQLKVLLLYVEQDLYNNERQSTAFGLLKAIIARKLIVPEVNEIMMKVGELSITSDLPHVRQQCRIVYQHFLMDYPVGNKLEKYVGFYLAQLGFQLQTGRESALDMIQILINSFPIYVIKSFSGTFLTNLGSRLINDDVPECRRTSAKCITSMLERLDKTDHDPLFDMIISWFKDTKLQHRTLAAQLCGLLANVEKEKFQSRIPVLMPIVLKQFTKGNEDAPGKFVRIKEEDSGGFLKTSSNDHHLYQVLQMLLKLCANCPQFMQNENMENLALRMQGLLSHPHDWVRLGAAQCLGYILSSIDAKKLSDLMINRTRASSGYLYSNPNESVKSLTLDLCAQLQPDCTKTEIAEQVIKNLIHISRVLQYIPVTKTTSVEEDLEDESLKRVNLLWLIKRVRRIINTEIAVSPKSTTLRSVLFKFIAALLTIIDIELLKPLLHHLAAPLVREIITKEKSTEELVRLSKEISNIIKSKISKEAYTQLLTNIESKLTVRRAERKRQRTQLAITDPELYAKKKIKHNEKKKELKKKNVGRRKGTFSGKRKRVVEIDDED